MTQRPIDRTTALLSSPLIIPSGGDDCQSWACLARELEPQPLTPTTDVTHPIPHRRSSPLLVAAGLLIAMLLGGATMFQVEQATRAVLGEASADFTHQNF